MCLTCGSINTFVQKDWAQTVSDVQGWLNTRASGYLERFHISPESVQSNVTSAAKSVGSGVAAWLGNFATALPGHIVAVFLYR